jgi:hypothetical protein
MLRVGNPWHHACWQDEGLNKVVAEIFRAAHRATFERRMLYRFHALGASEPHVHTHTIA